MTTPQNAASARPTGVLSRSALAIADRLAPAAHRTAPAARRAGSGRLWTLNAILAALGAAIVLAVVRPLHASDTETHLPWWALTALFLVAEVYVVHLHIRRDAHSLSLSEIPLVLGLFFADPVTIVLAQMLGGAAALAVHRRQSPLKLVFNISNFCIGTGLAAVVFHHVLGGQSPVGPMGWLAAFLATSTVIAWDVAILILAVSLSEGKPQLDRVPQIACLGLFGSVTNTCVALMAATVYSRDAWSLWLVLVPMVAVFLAYRAYTAERQKHERLQFLYESSRILQRSSELGSSVQDLLTHARRMFRAEVAEITLLPATADERVYRMTVGADGEPAVMEAVDLELVDQLLMVSACEQQGILLSRHQRREGRHQDFLAARGLKDAMVTALRGETRLMGTLMVGNRLGEVSTFDAEDLTLFLMLGNHASVSLENGRLEQSLAQLTELQQQLEHHAYYDSLTRLANRSLFSTRVEEAVARCQRNHSSLAVLFLDLDDFKLINDSLGHTAGDQLLVAVAARLQACLRPGDTASRLGGDEFGILLDETHGVEDARAVADRIVEALRAPVDLHGEEVSVRTSIGIVVSSTAAPAEELLRNADVAMYMAKAQGKGCYRLFVPSMQAAVHRRHELRADLQRAIERDEFVVHYQPIVHLDSGRIASVEALVRWNHPSKGLIVPNDFIPLAEETGLIVPIGRNVLRTACLQAKDWETRYPEHAALAMSVNLSVRQLHEPGFIAEVGAILHETGLTPHRLVLEITESVVAEDTEATISILHQLKSLGVRLAIDDFGTGYSSLSSLRHLPVDIFKIAKPFVDDLDEGGGNGALAQAIVRLGETLDLEMVAEGVESAAQMDHLRHLRCAMAQGFYFAVPLAGPDVDAILGSNAVAALWLERAGHGVANAGDAVDNVLRLPA